MTRIDHVVVLALENRSFDHMLGYLEHPSSDFDGLRGAEPHANPGWKSDVPVAATMDARYALPIGPDHSHDGVMEQIALKGFGKRRRPTNQGFVTNLERNCRGLAPRRHGGALGYAVDLLSRLRATAVDPALAGHGVLAMACQPPERVPVLSRLALEFAVCTRWFSSVPGETWPNRNFMHAATSDGETDVDVRYYTNRTIFELLSDNEKTWHIYYDDPPQVWAFPRLWDDQRYHANWFTMGHFASHVRDGDLPNYAFIEPSHRAPVQVVGDPSMLNGQDLARGERLIASVYETLRANPETFEHTLLVVTYDEHGGFYDHRPPPTGVPSPNGEEAWWTRLTRTLYHRSADHFDFRMLGVRVPAVLVSPYIGRHTVDTTVRDHASIPATVRELFALQAEYLTDRDRWSRPFHGVLNRDTPRRDDLPDLHEYATTPSVQAAPVTRRAVVTAPASPPSTEGTGEVPEDCKPFAAQAELVFQRLYEIGEPEFASPVTADEGDVGLAIVARFNAAAHRHRLEQAASADLRGRRAARTRVR